LNTNLLHNVLNVAITVVASMSMFDWSALMSPETSLKVVAVLGLSKLVMNAVRDGIVGMVKSQ